MHTTTGEAFDLCREIKPWRMVLTHFSPRYQKIMEISEENTELKILIAFDHLRLKLQDFEWAYHFLEIYDATISNESKKEEKEKVDEPKKKK